MATQRKVMDGLSRSVLHSTSFDAETKSLTDNAFSGSVLVLYTGGTIGMKINKDGVYEARKDYLYSWLTKQPYFHDEEHASQQREFERPFISKLRYDPLYLPVDTGKEKSHIMYVLMEFTPVIDSSNMDFDGMVQIAMDIKKYYTKFDGFVVLHGTDTMCYTAAALSFILENLGKPVVLTGSQIPIYETRSDGRDNFMGALVMASGFFVPEVCVYFDNKLFRGNRARKVSADTLDAFDSPNFPALAKMEIAVTVYWDLIQRPHTTKAFRVHTLLCPNVAILRIFPSISPQVVRAFLRDPIEGVVMQCYGAGNFPDENVEILEVLKEATDRGVIIVNTTQCRRGAVSVSYTGASALHRAGVVAGYDMTSEAALAKLSYVLTKQWTLKEKREFVSTNKMGELTSPDGLTAVKRGAGISKVWELLGLSAPHVGREVPEDLMELREMIILPLLSHAIKHGDISALEKVALTFPGNILISNFDGRTPLHIAVRDGSLEVVNYFINSGALVHVRDSFNQTPLMDAVHAKRFDVIELLVKAGAHLNMHPENLAVNMNQAASRGDLLLITAYWNAGAKLDVWDYSGRTPLHMAVLNWHVEMVDYMLKHGANPLIQNDCGCTVFSLTCHTGIITQLEAALVAKRWTKIKRRDLSTEVTPAKTKANNASSVVLSNLVAELTTAGEHDSQTSVDFSLPSEFEAHDIQATMGSLKGDGLTGDD